MATMLSCICLGVGEALIFAAIAAAGGLGAHATACKTSSSSTPVGVGVGADAATCCGHDHKPQANPSSSTDYDPAYKPKFMERQGAPHLSRAVRLTGLVALVMVGTFMFGLVGGSLLPHPDHNEDSDAPCAVTDSREHIHDHEHDHG